MALDSAAKRLAAIHMGMPWRGPAVLADGVISASDRVTWSDMYGGNSTTAYTITAESGTYSLIGYDATFVHVGQIDTAQKRLALMNMGSPWRGPAWLPIGGINKSGRSVLSHYYTVPVTVNNYILTAESGVYVWDGEPSFSDFEITCESGVYTYTGYDAILIATRTIFADSGLYTYTGYDANLIKFATRTMTATSGVYTYTGNDATLLRPRYLYAEAGFYSYTGRQATLTWYDAQGRPVRPGHGGGHPPHPPHPHPPHRLTVLQIHSEEDMLMLLATLCSAGLFNRRDD